MPLRIGKVLQPFKLLLVFLRLVLLLIPGHRPEVTRITDLVLSPKLDVEEPQGRSPDQLAFMPPAGLDLLLVRCHGLPEFSRSHVVEVSPGQVEDAEGPTAYVPDGEGMAFSLRFYFFFASAEAAEFFGITCST